MLVYYSIRNKMNFLEFLFSSNKYELYVYIHNYS